MIAVITGASRGIGRAVAAALSHAGWNVIALNRTPCDLPGVTSIPCDLTDAESVRSAFEQITCIDVLINNAGFGISGAVEYTDRKDVQDQFELNLFAHMCATQAALPLLRRSQGRVIYITSAAAVFPIPFQAFYSATKSALETVSRALRMELAPFGIQVCAIRLGDVKTGFTVARRKSGAGDDAYGGAIARSIAVMEHDEQNGMRPETVAKSILRLLNRSRLPSVYTVGLKYKLLCLLNRLLPTRLVDLLLRMIYRP